MYLGYMETESKRNPAADCGATFNHDPHLFRTPRGKVKACDGDTRKRVRS